MQLFQILLSSFYEKTHFCLNYSVFDSLAIMGEYVCVCVGGGGSIIMGKTVISKFMMKVLRHLLYDDHLIKVKPKVDRVDLS